MDRRSCRIGLRRARGWMHGFDAHHLDQPEGGTTPAFPTSAALVLRPEGPSSRALPPFCSQTAIAARCPDTLPTGENVGLIAGLHLYRMVRLGVREEHWSADTFGSSGSGIELKGPHGDGVTVFAYPAWADPNGVDLPTSDVVDAVASRDDVEVRDSGTWRQTWGTWMDVTPSPSAELTDDCRLSAPCVPMLVPMLQPYLSGVELRPGVVSRLFIEDGHEAQVRIAVWIHDLGGQDAALQPGRSRRASGWTCRPRNSRQRPFSEQGSLDNAAETRADARIARTTDGQRRLESRCPRSIKVM